MIYWAKFEGKLFSDPKRSEPNCSENRFIGKNKSISHVLFWNTARDGLSHLPLGSPPCRIKRNSK